MGFLGRLEQDITHPFGLGNAPRPAPPRTPAPQQSNRPVIQTPQPGQMQAQQPRPIAPLHMAQPLQQPHASIFHDLTHNPVTNEVGSIPLVKALTAPTATQQQRSQMLQRNIQRNLPNATPQQKQVIASHPNATPFQQTTALNQLQNKQNTQDVKNIGSNIVGTAQQFTTRPVVQLATSLAPRQLQVQATNPITRAIIGKAPVQNLEKAAGHNFQTHPNLPLPARVGLAAAYTAGQAANDVPVAAEAAKVVGKGAETASAITKAATTFNGLPAKQVIMDTGKLDALNNAKQILTAGTDNVNLRNSVNQGLHQIKNENGLDFITGSPASRLQRISQYLEQNGEAIPKLQARQAMVNNLKVNNEIGAVGKNVKGSIAPEAITAYHGSTNNKLTSLVPGAKTGLNEKRNLVYLTEDKKTAGDYAKTRGAGGQGVLKDSPTGKVYPVQVNGKVLDAYDRTGLDKLKSAPGYEQLSGKTKNHITNDTGLSPDILEANPELTNFLNQNGVTAVRTHLPNGGGATQLAVINHENLKLAQPTQVANTAADATAKPVSESPGAAKPATPQLQSGNASAKSVAGQARGLTTGIKGSKEFSPELQKSVTSAYEPFTNKAATQTTNEFMKQPIADAYKQVMDTLGTNNGAKQAFTGSFGKQEVSNAGAVMKALDAAGDHAGANAVHDALAQKLTNAGQAGQAASLIYSRTPDGLMNMARRDLGNAKVPVSPKLQTQLNNALDKIKNTEDGTRANDLARGKFQQIVGKQIPTSATNKALDIWRTGILSAPETAVKVAVANPINSVLENAADAVAAPVDKAVSLFTGKRSMIAPNARNIGAGLKTAGTRGLQDAGTRFKDNIVMPGSSGMGMTEIAGQGARAEGSNFGVAKNGGRTKLDKATGGVSSKLLNGYTSSIGRVHGALQTPFYEGRQAQSLMQTAQADAINQGLKGAQADAHIKNFVANPPQWAKDIASELAQYATSQQHTALGQAASGLQHNLGPLGRVIAPITRVPGAVATQMINYSPAGLAKTAGKAILDSKHGEEFNQQAFSRGIGRGIVGTGLLGGGAALAAKGRVSGQYPKDKATQQLWQSANIPANSVYVGGHAYPGEPWRNTGGTWQQVSSPGGAAAQSALAGGAAYDGYQKGGVAQAALQGAQGGAQIATNQPYLTGISGSMNAINDPASAKSFLDQTAGSIVPNFIKTGASATDPLQRQTSVQSIPQSIKNSITNGIPGARENNQPQVDVMGNVLPRNNSPLGAYLNPFKPQSSTPSALTNAMGAIHNNQDVNGKALTIPTQINKKYPITQADGKKVPLTDAQRTQFIQKSGQASQAQLNTLINSSAYKSASPDQQSKMVNDIVSGQRDLAKSQVPNSAIKLTAAGKAAKDGNMPSLGTDGKVHVGGTSDLNPKTSASDAKILKQYASMSSGDRTKKAYSQSNFDYQYAQAKYNNDKANGKLSKAGDIKAQANLAKEKIGANYSKDVRDLYGLSKAQIYDFITSDPNGKSYADQLTAYDNALKNAGIISTSKFKYGFGTKTASGYSSGKKPSTALPTPISYSNTAPKTTLGKFKVSKTGVSGATGKAKLLGYKTTTPKMGKVTLPGRSSMVKLATAPKLPKNPRPAAVKKVKKGVYA